MILPSESGWQVQMVSSPFSPNLSSFLSLMLFYVFSCSFSVVISLQFYFNTATETGIHFDVENSHVKHTLIT